MISQISILCILSICCQRIKGWTTSLWQSLPRSLATAPFAHRWVVMGCSSSRMLLRQQSTIPYLPCYLRAPIGCAYFNEHGRCCDRDGHNSHAHMNMPFTFLSRGLYVQCHSCICWQFLSQTHSHLLLVFTSGPFLAPRSLSVYTS